MISKREMAKLIENSQSTRQEWYDLYKATNMQSSIVAAHQALNNALITYLQKIDPSNNELKSIIKKKQALIIAEFIQLLQKRIEWDYHPKILGFLKKQNILEKFIDFEYEIHQNLGLLYRGGRSETVYIPGTQQAKQPIDMYFLSNGRSWMLQLLKR